jgi:sugar phosphate isomerase/epimerase
MTLKLGMPNLIELSDMNATAGLCENLGLSFIEMNMNMPDFCPEKISPDTLNEIRENKKIEFTLHLPEETDLVTFHTPVREGHLSRCIESLHWAHDCRIVIVNLHLTSGVYFSLPDRKVFIYEKYKDLFLNNLRDSFDRISDIAQQLGMTICIENCGDFGRTFIQEALTILLEKGNIMLTWDTGHDAKANFADSEFLMAHKEKIAHLHLHDSDHKNDHQALYDGCLDIKGILDFAQERKTGVVIEVKTIESLKESVKRLRDHGYVF